MNYFFCSLIFLLVSFSTLFAQTDPVENNEPIESNDTVIIEKAPVVVRKVMYIEEVVKPSSVYLEVYTSPFENFNYYNVCKDCKAYLDKLKETTKPTLGYSSGANLIYMKKHLYAGTGIAYTHVREIFKYPDVKKSHNTFNYLDINLSAGYRIKNKRLSIIIIGGGVLSNAISLQGHTISEADTVSMVDIRSQHQFRQIVFGVSCSIKFVYELGYKISFVAEPYYRGDLISNTLHNYFYVKQRNYLGSKVGLLYAF